MDRQHPLSRMSRGGTNKLAVVVTCAFAVLLISGWLHAGMLEVSVRENESLESSAAMEFSTVTTPGCILCPTHISIECTPGEYEKWAIDLHTKNKNCSSSGEWGGLVGTDNSDYHIPLYWQVYSDTQTVVAPDNDSLKKWGSVRDVKDKELSQALAERYIMTDSGLGNFPESEEPTQATTTYHAVLYLVGDFRNALNALAQDYGTTLCLDLTPRIYPSAPVISHEPSKYFSYLGWPVVLRAKIKGEAEMDNATVFVKGVGSEQISEIDFERISADVSAGNVPWRAEIPVDLLSRDGIQYRIEAMDKDGNFGYWPGPSQDKWFTLPYNARVTQRITPLGGTITLEDGNPDNGTVTLEIPEGALREPVVISITQVDVAQVAAKPDGSRAASAWRLEPDELVFMKPATLTLLYQKESSKEVSGSKNQSSSEGNLGVYWWDSRRWRMFGGAQQEDNCVVTAKVVVLGDYLVATRTAYSPGQVKPLRRIITPATRDQHNDAIIFGDIGDSVIKIFDLNGRVVRVLNSNPMWDGTDSQGRTVESGIYIYQVYLPDGTLSGTVVVAK